MMPKITTRIRFYKNREKSEIQEESLKNTMEDQDLLLFKATYRLKSVFTKMSSEDL